MVFMSAHEPHTELEIKLAFLEKHVHEQDRAVYEQQKRIDLLERAVRALSERVKNLSAGGGEEDEMPADEKPPHY